MTDRELLELAAKAAGYCQFDGHAKQMVHSGWNPIEDDGDALRLSVNLGIFVWVDGDIIVWCSGVASVVGSDPHDAATITRRAIVRAAAALGEQA